MDRTIIIDCQNLTFMELINNIKSFKNLTILIPCPLIVLDNTIIEYFMFQPIYSTFHKQAQNNNVNCIYDIQLNGLGTKKSQNKKLITQLIGRSSYYQQLNLIPREMRNLLNKKHFEKQSPSGKKKNHGCIRYLNLDDPTVQEAHVKLLIFLENNDIKRINISDATEDYITYISEGSDLKITSYPEFTGQCLDVESGEIGFKVVLGNDKISTYSKKLLKIVQENGTNEISLVYNKNNVRLFSGKSMLIIQNNSSFYYRFNKNYPRKKLPLIDGTYEDTTGSYKVDIKNGCFRQEIKIYQTTLALFSYKKSLEY